MCQRLAIDLEMDDLVVWSAVWWLTGRLVRLTKSWGEGVEQGSRFGNGRWDDNSGLAQQSHLAFFFFAACGGEAARAPPLLGGKCGLKSTQGDEVKDRRHSEHRLEGA